MKLSILIPAFNEEKTILQLLEKVERVQLMDGIEKEVIIIDDCSTDKTWALLQGNSNWILLRHKKNRGKGAAIKTGLKKATGDFVIVQDADLEYDPQDYNLILEEILNKKARVVYGSRILKEKKRPKKNLFKGKHPDSYWLAYLGGVFISWFTNLNCGLQLTDEPTCYKCFERKLIQSIKIENDDFAWEPEVTVKIARKGVAIHEVPISYHPRTNQEGKKIGWKDGLKALWTILKYRWFSNG